MDKSAQTTLITFRKLLYEHVDPIRVSVKLSKLPVLNVQQKTYILSLSGHDRIEVWKHLFPILKESFRLQQLLQVLLECGYIEIFLQIATYWRCIQSSGKEIAVVHRGEKVARSRRFSEVLFIQLKIKTHNIGFKGNPRADLHHQSELYKAEYLGEIDKIERQVKADKYAASLCAEIDAHTMLYVRKMPTHGLFEELKHLTPHTSNTHITQIAYDSRLAIAHAIAEDDTKGEGYLHNAMVSSLYVGYCVELVNMLYICVFNLLCIYEKHPSKRTLDKILNIAEFSLNCLQEEKDDIIRNFWMRMFFLRMTYCLLGLSNKGDLIPGCIILPNQIQRARELLVEVNKVWNGIETRRQMFYYVAQARIAELENIHEDLDLAKKYISMAINIGQKGHFGETAFIQEYSNELTERSFGEIEYTKDAFSNRNGPVSFGLEGVEHDENVDNQSDKTKIKQFQFEENDSKSFGYNQTHNNSTINPNGMMTVDMRGTTYAKLDTSSKRECDLQHEKDETSLKETESQSRLSSQVLNEIQEHQKYKWNENFETITDNCERLCIQNDSSYLYDMENFSSLVCLNRPDSVR